MFFFTFSGPKKIFDKIFWKRYYATFQFGLYCLKNNKKILTLKKRASKVAHNRPRSFYSTVLPRPQHTSHSPQPRIDFPYEISGPDICSLICGYLVCPLLFTYWRCHFFGEKKNKEECEKNDGNNSMTSQEENINVAASSISVFSSWNKSFLTTWQILIYSWEYLLWLLWWLRLVVSEVNWFYFVNFCLFSDYSCKYVLKAHMFGICLLCDTLRDVFLTCNNFLLTGSNNWFRNYEFEFSRMFSLLRTFL